MPAARALRRDDPVDDLDALAAALESAEELVVTTIGRECEALRAGRLLAAKALRDHLSDACNAYLDLAKATHSATLTQESAQPHARLMLEERRRTFSAILRIELAALAAERAAARPDALPELSGQDRTTAASPRIASRRA